MMTTIPLDFIVATDENVFTTRCQCIVSAWLWDMEGEPAMVAAHRAIALRETEHIMACDDWTRIPYTMLGTADVLEHRRYIERRTVVDVPGIMGYTHLEYRVTEWGKRFMEGGVI